MSFKLTMRDIKRLFKGHGRAAKKKKNMIMILTVIAIFLLLGFLYITNRDSNSRVVSNESSSFEKDEVQDKEKIITESINYRDENPNSWLYASTNLNYDEVYNVIVLNENSEYSLLASRKERSEWLDRYLEYFGWNNIETEDGRSTSGEPEMVSLSTAMDIGTYCGFSNEETSTLLSGL